MAGGMATTPHCIFRSASLLEVEKTLHSGGSFLFTLDWQTLDKQYFSWYGQIKNSSMKTKKNFFVQVFLTLVCYAPSFGQIQGDPFTALPLLYEAEWVTETSDYFEYSDLQTMSLFEEGCWMINEKYQAGTAEKVVQGCYDTEGSLVAFPYDTEELSRVKTSNPRKARNYEFFSHLISSFEGGNPNPNGGDTLLVYDKDHAFIGELVVDGNSSVQDSFPESIGGVVLEPHDDVVFMLGDEIYVAVAVARKGQVVSGAIYWMQSVTLWKLDRDEKIFKLVHLFDVDGMLDYALISQGPSSYLDFFHFNEWSVDVVDNGNGLERAVIAGSARNNSNIFIFYLDEMDNGLTSFSLKHVLGNQFPVLAGLDIPYTLTEDDEYPLLRQHGSAVSVDTVTQSIIIASLNNGAAGSPIGNPVNRQALSYVVYRVDMESNTAEKVSTHVVVIGGDTLYGQFQGGCEFLDVSSDVPLLAVYSGVDAFFDENGNLQLAVGNEELFAEISNASIYRCPPFNPTWEEVSRFKVPDVMGAMTNRNILSFVPSSMKPSLAGDSIFYGYDYALGRTAVFHASSNHVWRVGNETMLGDTLLLDGVWPFEQLVEDVTLWVPDSMYLWKVSCWSAEPVWVITGTSSLSSKLHFSVHPNPTSGMVRVCGDSGSYALYDIRGLEVFSYLQEHPFESRMLDISFLPDGIYILVSDKGAKKIIKS